MKDGLSEVLAVVSCEFRSINSSFKAELEALELGMFVFSRLGSSRVKFEVDNIDL